MKLTAQEEYGLRCLLHVARHAPDPAGPPVSIRAIAEGEGLSLEYAAKLLRALRQVGFVQSVRGAAGGYTLSRPPHETSAFEVLRTLDGPLFDEGLCKGQTGRLGPCVHDHGCSLRVLWKWVDVALESVLARITLADLLAGDAPKAPPSGRAVLSSRPQLESPDE